MSLDRPLGMKSYGRIPHLPGSALTATDRVVSASEAARMIQSSWPGDQLWIHEKLDGTNLSVARIEDDLVALTRAGHRARESRRPQAQLFTAWVEHHSERFLDLLEPGERLVGEWLLFAHGTRYQLKHEPFVVFDLMRGQMRAPWLEVTRRVGSALPTPTVHATGPADPSQLFRALGSGGHGAWGPCEGLVYRIERESRVDRVAKWVRPEYRAGRYFEAEEATLPQGLWGEDAELFGQLSRDLGLPTFW